MNGEQNRRLINVSELSKLLGVPVSWIYQQTRLGPKAIPQIRIGKYVRFDPQEVVAFFREKGTDGKPTADDVS